MEIIQARTERDFAQARTLFEEYADSLGFDLCFQHFVEELATLHVMYGPPHGCLLLAVADSKLAGCVALRDKGGGTCEMKRLYVRPAYRGCRLGRQLAEAIVDKACQLGFQRMLLDTLDWMEPARALYRSIGFRETLPYYHNPLKGVVYLELELRAGIGIMP